MPPRPRNLRRVAFAVVAAAFFGLGAREARAVDVSLTPGASLRQAVLVLDWPMKAPLPHDAFGISETRLRPTLRADVGDDVSLAAGVETRAGFTSLSLPGAGLTGGASLLGVSQPLRYFDWRWKQLDEPRAYVATTIERADVFWHAGPVDVDAGRQPVSLGSSRFVGVLDVIAPFAPGDLDSTYKPGVDAVRVRTGWGVSNEAEVIAVAAKTPGSANPAQDGALLARLRTNVSTLDVEALGGRFRQRGFGGLSWEGDLGFAGWWGEAALFERKTEPWRAGWRRAAFSGVTGLERNLPGEVLAGAGVFYHDFGARKAADLEAVATDEPFQQGWEFLPGAAYAVLTGQWQAHPLVLVNAAALVNLVDASSLWQPRVQFSVADNADLTAFAWIGAGPAPYAKGAALVVPSDFGRTPDGGGLYARWFF